MTRECVARGNENLTQSDYSEKSDIYFHILVEVFRDNINVGLVQGKQDKTMQNKTRRYAARGNEKIAQSDYSDNMTNICRL